MLSRRLTGALVGLALVSLLVPVQPSRPRAQPDETSLGPLFPYPYCAPVRIPDGRGAETEREAALAGGEEKYPCRRAGEALASSPVVFGFGV